MFQLDSNLEFSIFNRVYNESLEKLKADLIERGKKVAWIYQRDNLTADQLKRAQIEEKHLKVVSEFIDNSNHVINLMIDQLLNKKEDQILWHDEWMREVESNRQFVESIIAKYKKLK
jgi:hypothetical protein